MPVENKSIITINLKWLHLLLGVVVAVLTVMLTLGTVTSKYVDSRVEVRIVEQEKVLREALDSRMLLEAQERKEQIKLVREDLFYIREKVDAIALHLDGRNR